MFLNASHRRYKSIPTSLSSIQPHYDFSAVRCHTSTPFSWILTRGWYIRQRGTTGRTTIWRPLRLNVSMDISDLFCSGPLIILSIRHVTIRASWIIRRCWFLGLLSYDFTHAHPLHAVRSYKRQNDSGALRIVVQGEYARSWFCLVNGAHSIPFSSLLSCDCLHAHGLLMQHRIVNQKNPIVCCPRRCIALPDIITQDIIWSGGSGIMVSLITPIWLLVSPWTEQDS